ncbi:MAG: exo-alpha-sialidase, partial [Nocardiopsaceae bacterium]|nr:exo-alpha-sialidase [Nocardiopsaceae bacterium]
RRLGVACAAFVLAAGAVSWRLAEPAPSAPSTSFASSGTLPTASAAVVPRGSAPDADHGSPGAWRLTSYLAKPAGWTRNTAGPKSGFLSCAAHGACYDASGNALYVTQDTGRTWTAIQMPGGASFTSALDCPAAGHCLAGGKIEGHDVLLMTDDGGIHWSYRALPPGDGFVSSLQCQTDTTCHALAGTFPAPHSYMQKPGEIWLLTTGDAGRNWSRHDFPAADLIDGLSCWSANDCVATGGTGKNGKGGFYGTRGIALRTTDGGATWTPGTVPPKLSLITYAGPGDGYVTCPAAGTCYALAAKEPMKRANFTVVASTDGGATWHELALPPHTPFPNLSAISCASARACWTAGSQGVPVHIPGKGRPGFSSGYSPDSPVILSTADGGATWAKTTFPPGRAATGNQFDAMTDVGSVACSSASSCLATGVGNEGAHVPVYTISG